jgi:hypothetical protein
VVVVAHRIGAVAVEQVDCLQVLLFRLPPVQLIQSQSEQAVLAVVLMALLPQAE